MERMIIRVKITFFSSQRKKKKKQLEITVRGNEANFKEGLPLVHILSNVNLNLTSLPYADSSSIIHNEVRNSLSNIQ